MEKCLAAGRDGETARRDSSCEEELGTIEEGSAERQETTRGKDDFLWFDVDAEMCLVEGPQFPEEVLPGLSL